MIKLNSVCLILCLILTSLTGMTSRAATQQALQKNLTGLWHLKELKCNGAVQSLGDMDYTLSFNGKKGEYVSKNKGCQQNEPEIYGYPSATTVSIKSGVRTCAPNPCAADLEATQCGKETNPATPVFDVQFKDANKTMILSTSDPKSVDCVGAGQSKPAVFTFAK